MLVMGNERADEFARNGQSCMLLKSDVAAVGVNHKLIKHVAETAATVLAVPGLVGQQPFWHAVEWFDDRWRCSRRGSTRWAMW